MPTIDSSHDEPDFTSGPHLVDIQASEGESLPEEMKDYFTPPQRSAQFYTDYVVQHLYFWEGGIDMMAVAGAAGQAVHARPVRRHAPIQKLAVFWQAQRIAKRPVLPHWDLSETNPNAVLLKMFFITTAPKPMPGGRLYAWTCEGLYLYGLYAPLKEGDALWSGCTPVGADWSDNLRTEGYQFSKDILRSLPPADYDENAAKAII